jgi:murein DD-endopeptidase MepM/ murein hydrolase activator NlpD
MSETIRAAASGPARPAALRASALCAAALALAGCATGPLMPTDWDLRSTETLNTAAAARMATVARPAADDRGVISYPGYQVALARRGDTVRTLAARIGVDADALAARNAIASDVILQGGEVLLIPGRVAEPLAAAPVDVAAIATTALDRAQGAAPAAAPPAPPPPAPAAGPPRPVVQMGAEPKRHRVLRGESAFTIARLYNVPVEALAEWNGLGPGLALREGQTLLIPPFAETPPPATATATAAAAPPGAGSPTPTPPSAARPLPQEQTAPAAAPLPAPPSPGLAAGRTAASASRFAMPAEGAIIRAFSPQRPGIDIAAAAGAPVRAAADGTVMRATRDTNGITLVLIRHEDDLVTVYANIADLEVTQGATVRRGQQIARVAAGDRPFLRFDVRRGVDAIDPAPFLQ